MLHDLILLVLLKQVIGELCAEEGVTGLRLLSDESLNDVVQGDFGSTDGLAIEDFTQPPQPKDVLGFGLGAGN